MKFTILIICLFFEGLIAEIYPLAQKPFLDGLESSDGFQRGTFLIIVASSDLEGILSTNTEYIGNFIYFKQTQGFDVEVWNFQEFSSDKENLRESLATYYSNNPLLEYVLLIGDFNTIDDSGLTYPLDSFTILSYNEPQQDVTDHPFTYFEGDPTTNHGLNPNFFIGRWSISSINELKTIQKKTIQYTKLELVNDLSYLDRALIVAGSYKTENNAETYPIKWPVSPVWTSLWLQDRLTQFGYSKVDTALFYLGNIQSTNPTIANAWNNGVGVINYRGWGNAQGWVKPQFFIDPDLINLSNNYELPVVFSFVCNTGDFGNDIEPSFGEKMVRSGSSIGQMMGAVAMIGPSDLDTDTRFNNVMCGALWDGLLEGRTPELAQALHAAKQAIAKEFYDIEEKGVNGGITQDIPVFYHHVYGVLGDPSLPVWLSQPTELSVLNNASETISGNLMLSDMFINIQVQDSGGQPLQDVVGALLYNGELIAKGLSTIDGNLDIDFTDISNITAGSEMELYLNKAQFFQKRIPVILYADNSNIFEAHSYGYQIPVYPEYYDVNTIDYNWVELNPDKGGIGENLYLTDDEIVADVPIGFDFTYYGYTYTTVNICSNGWVSFEKSTIPYFWNFSIPFPIGPTAMLAVFMDDLDDNGKEPFIDNNDNHIYDSGDVFITDCGTPENPSYPCHDYNQDGERKEGEPFNVFKFQDIENHRFIVQWDELSNAEDDENCGTSSGCVKETFQMIIYEDGEFGQGNIVFQYKEIHDIDDGRVGKNGNLSTIGIESPDQNLGFQYLFRGSLWDGTTFTTLQERGLNETAIQFSANQEIISNSGSYLETKFVEQPSSFQLIGAYPNPFNPTTTVQYSLSEFSWINLIVYNIRGQKLTTLYNGTNIPGEHSVVWNASNYASGVYFISLKANGTTITQKVLLLK